VLPFTPDTKNDMRNFIEFIAIVAAIFLLLPVIIYDYFIDRLR